MSDNFNGVSNSNRRRKAGEVIIPPKGKKTQKVGADKAPNPTGEAAAVNLRQALQETREKQRRELHDWATRPQGRDVPQMLSAFKPKDSYVLIHKQGTKERPAEFQLLKNAKTQFDLESQAPSMRITKAGYKLTIRSENVEPGKNIPDPIMEIRELDFEEDNRFCDPATFNKLICAEHRMGNYSDDPVAMEMIEFGWGNAIKKERGGKKKPVQQINTTMKNSDRPEEAATEKAQSCERVEAPKSTKTPAQDLEQTETSEVTATPNTDASGGLDATHDAGETAAPEATNPQGKKSTSKPKVNKDEKSTFRKGLAMVSFNVHGKLWFEEKGVNKSDEMEKLLDDLKEGGCSILIVRDLRNYNIVAWEYWHERMAIAVTKGVWSFYNDAIGSQQGNLFDAWRATPNKRLKRQLWMQQLNLKKEKKNLKRYASHKVKKAYGSTREFEIVHSVALIYETMYEKTLVDEYFGYDKPHNAIVTESNNGYVVVHVSVEKGDLPMPPIGTDTKFGVKRATFGVPTTQSKEETPEVPEYDLITQPEEEQEAQPDSKGEFELSDAFKGHSIDIETEADFVVSFNVPKRKDRKMWNVGEQIQVALEMERNPIPIIRQLKAIGFLSRKLRLGGKKGDPRSAFLMQDVLMGAGNPKFDDKTTSVSQDNLAKMPANEQKVFNDYIQSLKLNKRQQELFDTVFNRREFVTQMQGPPGTGKTRTTTSLAISFSLLRLKTALCAPTNVAVQACIDNVMIAMNDLRKMDPKIDERLKVVVIPNSANLKESLANLGEVVTAYDMMTETSEKEEFRYSLLNHVIRSFQSRLRTKSGEWQQAEKWLEVKNKMESYEHIGIKDLRTFVEMGMAESTYVLKDPNVRLVISTSSNADIMKEYGYKPMALVHDESGFSVGPETMIALQLCARFNVIVGDHLQLKPIVRGRGYNEHALTRGMSIYEQLYGHHSIPLVRLNVNYRMHPDIAELPGLLTYEWLGCDDSTKVESETYKYFHDWQVSPRTPKKWTTPRKPEFGGVADSNDRVRWLNVIGGWASPKAGLTSYRNFMNIQAAVEFVISLVDHGYGGALGQGISQLDPMKITLLSPYKDDCTELQRQLRWAMEAKYPGLPLPQITVVDKIQGGQNEIVLLMFTPNHCNILGFLKEWNRLNVAGTRAQSVFYIFGNYEALRDQLHHIVNMGCKKLALMLIDYAYKGRVINVMGQTFRLPASPAETPLAESHWTLMQNPCPTDLTKETDEQKKAGAKVTEDSRKKLELQLFAELTALRAKADRFQKEFDEFGHATTSLEFDILRQDKGDDVEDDTAAADVTTATPSTTVAPGPNNPDDDDLDLQAQLLSDTQTDQPVISRADENGDDPQTLAEVELVKNLSLSEEVTLPQPSDEPSNEPSGVPGTMPPNMAEALDQLILQGAVDRFKHQYKEKFGELPNGELTEPARIYIIKCFERENLEVPDYLIYEIRDAEEGSPNIRSDEEDQENEVFYDDPVREDINQVAEGYCREVQKRQGLPVGPPYPYSIRCAAVDAMISKHHQVQDMPDWLTSGDIEMTGSGDGAPGSEASEEMEL